MDKISEILSLSHFDADSEKNHQDSQNKHSRYYKSVRKLPDTKNDKSHDNIEQDNASENWLEEDRRKGEERRLREIDRNKRFEYRKKRDRRKSKSIFVKA